MFLFFVKNVKHYSKQISFSHLQGYKHATSKIKNNYALKSILVNKIFQYFQVILTALQPPLNTKVTNKQFESRSWIFYFEYILALKKN